MKRKQTVEEKVGNTLGFIAMLSIPLAALLILLFRRKK